MPHFRKKPVVVEAEQWLGWSPDGVQEERLGIRTHPRSLILGRIETLEGGHDVTPGDFIITGVAGEKYPCKEAIFRATYTSMEQPQRHDLSHMQPVFRNVTDHSAEYSLAQVAWQRTFPDMDGYYWFWNGEEGAYNRPELARITGKEFGYCGCENTVSSQAFPGYCWGPLQPPSTTGDQP